MQLKYYLSRFWLAISISFYLFTPYLIRYTHEFNRFVFHWTLWDLLSLLLCIVLLGTLFFLFFIILYVRGKNFTKKVFELTFIAVLGVACVANVFHLVRHNLLTFSNLWIRWMIHLYSGYFLWSLLCIFIIYAALRHTKRIKTLCITLFFIVSPLLPIFTLNALRYQSITSNSGSLTMFSENKNPNKVNTKNVFIFIFDEWSYQKTFSNRKLIAEFSNLKQFKDLAFVFHQACSPGPNTFASMPAFLFQTNLRFTTNGGRTGFKGERFQPLNQTENIFHHARELGFYTCIIGSYMPYGGLLEGSIDFAKSISVAKRFGDSFFDVAKYHSLTAALMLPAPFFHSARRRVSAYFFNRFQINRINATHELFKAIVQNQSQPTYAVFHYMIPHFPYIFNRSGHKKLFAIYKGREASNYYGNLSYLDKKIGEITSILKKANKFENSLIIMTSDHSWRKDPDYRKTKLLMEKRHVPLFAKMPYQKHSIEINSKFNTYKLGSFINKYLDGEFTLAEVKPLLDKENYFNPIPLELKTTEHLPLNKGVNKNLKSLGYISNESEESPEPPSKGCKANPPYENQ